jgi:hypothetical protein
VAIRDLIFSDDDRVFTNERFSKSTRDKVFSKSLSVGFVISDIVEPGIELGILLEFCTVGTFPNELTGPDVKFSEYIGFPYFKYINAKNKICLEQMKRFEKDFDITYEKAFIQKYNDINYNISIV